MLEERVKRQGCNAHPTARLLADCSISNSAGSRARIQIGAYTVSHGELNVFPPNGSIKVGSYCFIGDHSRIWSAIGASIGDRVLISHCVNIHDHNVHPKSATKRHMQEVAVFAGRDHELTDVNMAQIVIEDDAWIGFNVTIMKGVTIGKGAIIGAASVITKDVAPYAIMVGNPARQIGTAFE